MRFYNLDGIEEDIMAHSYYYENHEKIDHVINYRIEIDLSKTQIEWIARIYANSDFLKEYRAPTDLEVRRIADAFVSGLQFKDDN